MCILNEFNYIIVYISIFYHRMFSLSGLLFAGQPQVIKVQTAQSKQMVTSGIRPLNTQAVRAIIKPNTDGTQVRIE